MISYYPSQYEIADGSTQTAGYYACKSKGPHQFRNDNCECYCTSVNWVASDPNLHEPPQDGDDHTYVTFKWPRE